MPMRKCLIILGIVLMAFSLTFIGGCKKKRVTTPTPPPPEPVMERPTITLTASPSSIKSGESSKLSWTSTGATSVTIEPEVGAVETSGSITVSPAGTTTYVARATGRGGSREAEARVTVVAPEPPPPPPTTTRPTQTIEEILSAMDIFFDFDKYNIRPDAQDTLTENAPVLRDLLAKNTDLRTVIEGHCDERGTPEYNMALGDRRATATKEALVSMGVSSDRMTAVSYGKEGSPNYRPDPGSNEEAWAKNRRAHFVKK